jgi:hypothetical protein
MAIGWLTMSGRLEACVAFQVVNGLCALIITLVQ